MDKVKNSVLAWKVPPSRVVSQPVVVNLRGLLPLPTHYHFDKPFNNQEELSKPSTYLRRFPVCPHQPSLGIEQCFWSRIGKGRYLTQKNSHARLRHYSSGHKGSDIKVLKMPKK